MWQLGRVRYKVGQPTPTPPHPHPTHTHTPPLSLTLTHITRQPIKNTLLPPFLPSLRPQPQLAQVSAGWSRICAGPAGVCTAAQVGVCVCVCVYKQGFCICDQNPECLTRVFCMCWLGFSTVCACVRRHAGVDAATNPLYYVCATLLPLFVAVTHPSTGRPPSRATVPSKSCCRARWVGW